MRIIEYTNAFKRDYKKAKASPKYHNIDLLLTDIVQLLQKNLPLAQKNYDHNLIDYTH